MLMNGLPNGVEKDGRPKSDGGGHKKKGKGGTPPVAAATGGGGGTGSMYAIRPPFELPEIPLPDVMYHVKPVAQREGGQSSNNSNPVNGHNCPVPGTGEGGPGKKINAMASNSESSEVMDNLEQRQVKIIEKLRSLRDVITDIHKKCVGTSDAATSKTSDDSISVVSHTLDIDISENIDVAIHANPQNPPFSLLFFANIFEQCYANATVSIKAHTHSSYEGTLNGGILSIFNQEKDGANFKFTVIWKDVDECMMVISPIQSTFIFGEANLARFLSRLLPTSSVNMNYDCLNWNALVRVDELLQSASSDNVVTIVEEELKKGKQKCLASEPTIADLVLYSAVASKVILGKDKDKIVPGSVKDWFKYLEVTFGLYLDAIS